MFRHFRAYRYDHMSRIDVHLCARKVVLSLLHVDNSCGHTVMVRRFRAYIHTWQYLMDIRICVCKASCVAFLPYDWSGFDIFVPIYMTECHFWQMFTYIPSIPSSSFLLFLQISHSISIGPYILSTKGSYVSFGVLSLHRLRRRFLPLFAGIVSSSGNPFSCLPIAQIWHWP